MAHTVLFVHAHPDDETITTGATMARYVAAGAHVALLTCTRGEQGEVIPARLAGLFGDGSALGAHRVGELAAAMAALGVTDHRFLGAPDVNYADSGMAYAANGDVVPAADPPAGAFALADIELTAARLADLIGELRPQVVVTYDPHGGYGHPDHIQAHVITMRAVELAQAAGWPVPKVYWVVSSGDQASTVVDAQPWVGAKLAALRAHETQLLVTSDDAFFALSNGVRQPVTGVEYYRLVRGERAGHRDAAGLETDLLAGLSHRYSE